MTYALTKKANETEFTAHQNGSSLQAVNVQNRGFTRVCGGTPWDGHLGEEQAGKQKVLIDMGLQGENKMTLDIYAINSFKTNESKL